MRNYIQRDSAAIFFSVESLTKTGHCLGVCHGGFHLHGLARGTRTKCKRKNTK